MPNPEFAREECKRPVMFCVRRMPEAASLATNAPSRLKGSSSGPPTLSHQSLPKSKVLPGSALQGAKLRGERTQIGNTQDDSVGTSEEKFEDGDLQSISKPVLEDNAAALVKSPPEPTRVKSPEQIIMRSPEPVNWTVPLDTGKTFTVTQNIHEGVNWPFHELGNFLSLQ
ncbi:unnamed protein product [Timema podura]|uniref:Nuclear protein MDM1 n=1 Tax=Timema podura TaxID=61482 RepID=A0ABN7NER0_TIMPD|nr:unnamed protein product [Timema podura]